MIAEVHLPLEETNVDTRKYEDHKDGGGLGTVSDRIEVVLKINHDGEPNKYTNTLTHRTSSSLSSPLLCRFFFLIVVLSPSVFVLLAHTT